MRLLKEPNSFYLERRINYKSYKRTAVGKQFSKTPNNNGVYPYLYYDYDGSFIRKCTFRNCYYL